MTTLLGGGADPRYYGVLHGWRGEPSRTATTAGATERGRRRPPDRTPTNGGPGRKTPTAVPPAALREFSEIQRRAVLQVLDGGRPVTAVADELGLTTYELDFYVGCVRLRTRFGRR